MEPSAVLCQERCASVGGCAHFSFWGDRGCHLQVGDADVREGSGAAWAGPRECGHSLAQFSFYDSGRWRASAVVTSVDNATCEECARRCLHAPGCRAFSTEEDCATASARGRCTTTGGAASEGWVPAGSSHAYVHLDAAACFEPGGRYEPLDMGGQERSEQVSAVRCQELCLSVPHCAHFSYYSDGGCHLQDGAASFQQGDGATAWPASCSQAGAPGSALAVS